MTLIDWMPYDYDSAFNDLVLKHGDKKVVKERQFNWRFTKHKNVINWCILEDGSAVGWNESPAIGESFIRAGKRKVESVIGNQL